MTYQETIDYLFHKLPMFSHIGSAALKKDLYNTIALCNALGNPHTKFKSIHIAGTNGKGSTSHMIAATLQKAGYKTGLYTSPHLKDFRERIKINGVMCEEQFVVDFVGKVEPLIEQLQPSFFELTVAMAFEYFAQQQVDVAVIEVGLGGTLDSTNIITPELSVITNIGLDHVNILGDTLEKIAGEKAGIIKSNIPAVIGEWQPEIKHVFEQAAVAKNAPLVFAAQEYWASDWQYEQSHLSVTVTNKKTDEHVNYQLDLPGVYQVKNIITVIAAIQQLKNAGWNISDAVGTFALSQVKKLTGLHGRWEILQQDPLIITDVCHNEDGIRQMIEQLELCTYNHLHIVFGMVKDKDIQKVLSLLPTTATYYFTKAQIQRAMPENELAQKAAAFDLKGKTFATVREALSAAKQQAHKKDMILVCGSVFVVAEV